MVKTKRNSGAKETRVYGEVHFVVSEIENNFLLDSKVMRTISEINKLKRLNVVAADQDSTYSLVYRYCAENEIDFFSKGLNLRNNPNCIDELLAAYQLRAAYSPKGTIPNIAYLTNSIDCKTLKVIARKLTDEGVKTEIRTIF